jgi:spore coat polysaccharide biosynthesis protein SpsF
MNAHVIIQARMGSSRLPGKILLPFVGSTSYLEWVVERCKLSQRVSKVIVATTDSSKDDPIEAFCKEKKYDHVRGNENDVLARYALAAEKFGGDILIRVTSDCPLVDVSEMERAIEFLQSEGFDYVSTHPGGLPLGGGAEVFTRAAFERVVNEAKDPYEHEHVTPSFYRHPELFAQKNIVPLYPHPFAREARLVLDYPEDHAFLSRLAKDMLFSTPGVQPSTYEILEYLRSHPDLVLINKDMIQKSFPKA